MTNTKTSSATVPSVCKIANPAPLGLFSFAATSLILSLYNVNARGVTVPNVVVGMGIFCSGFAQILAGVWAFPRGDTFSASAFISFGAFWMSFGTILIPGSGIMAAYPDPKDFQNALGIYLATWAAVTFLFLVVTLQKNIGFIFLFGSVFLTFALLASANLTRKNSIQVVGGIVGIFAGLAAFYVGLSELLDSESQPVIRLPLGVIHVRQVNK